MFINYTDIPVDGMHGTHCFVFCIDMQMGNIHRHWIMLHERVMSVRARSGTSDWAYARHC
jgi:hypothetical protein